MKHDYLDKYSRLDSFIHKLDPRVKLICFFLAVVAVVSEPRGDLTGFPFYYLLIILLLAASRIPLSFVLKRCLIASPFIVMAAGVLPLSYLLSPGASASPSSAESMWFHPLSILLKAYAAVILLTLLSSTEKFHRLLNGLQKLKFPPVLGVMSALMYRYIFILNDEMLRTTRARKSRTPGKSRISRFRIYGNQAALIFLRGKKRAQDVYNAMMSRGFQGEFQEYNGFRLKLRDGLFSLLFLALYTGVRFGL
ncbi:MAG: cobalt ECF transporter T component CbiQ [Candidatus Aminicenantes bacterium]|nr:cobalt ECF transporter T component CbiQ [Candidatus Aminicenantes bacterium]